MKKRTPVFSIHRDKQLEIKLVRETEKRRDHFLCTGHWEGPWVPEGREVTTPTQALQAHLCSSPIAPVLLESFALCSQGQICGLERVTEPAEPDALSHVGP